MVEACAVDLSTVNTVLKKEVDQSGDASPALKLALTKSEDAEVRVEESADELVSVNAALAEGIQERKSLTDELATTYAALTESRRQARKARSDALHDPLTGLPNFTLFKDRLDVALSQARRHEWRVAVMFIDLDRFKHINDTHGHDVGDACLQIIGERLETNTRAEDTACRRSGDEFQFLMTEARSLPIIEALALKLFSAMQSSCEVRSLNLSIKPSIGIAVYPDNGHSAQELLEKADAAMYAAKHRSAGPLFWSRLEPVALLPAQAGAIRSS